MSNLLHNRILWKAGPHLVGYEGVSKVMKNKVFDAGFLKRIHKNLPQIGSKFTNWFMGGRQKDFV